MNIANLVTLGRLVLSVIYFIVLLFVEKNHHLFYLSLFLFIIAVLTDALDGYLARRYQKVTPFGRVLDPFVDKVLICGTFIFFTSWDSLKHIVPPWVVVVIVAREFIIQTIRGLGESSGIDFSSNIWGKFKMTIQSITIISIFTYLGFLSDIFWPLVVVKALVWLTLFSSILSCLTYLSKSKNILETTKGL